MRRCLGVLAASFLTLGSVNHLPAFLNREGAEVTDLPGFEGEPAAAFSPLHDNFLVVFASDGGGTDWQIYGQRVSASGDPIGGEFPIGPSNGIRQPDVAYSETSDVYLVVWDDVGEVYARRVSGITNGGNGGGQLVGSQFDIVRAFATQWKPSVAWNSLADEFYVVWEDRRDTDPAVRGRRVSPTGTLIDADQEVAGDAESPDVAFEPITLGGNFLVVWKQHSALNLRTHGARRVAFDGTPLGVFIDLNDGDSFASQGAPAVSYGRTPGNGRFMVAYTVGSEMRTRRVAPTAGGGDAGGELLGGEEVIGVGDAESVIAMTFVREFLDHWLVVWNRPDTFGAHTQASWLSTSGMATQGTWPLLASNRTPALALRTEPNTGGDLQNDLPRLFSAEEITFSNLNLFAREVPEQIGAAVSGETDRIDFLRVETSGSGWQMAVALPEAGHDVALRMFNPLLFFTIPLETSDAVGPGQAEIIAIDSPEVREDEWPLLLSFDTLASPPHRYRAQVASAGTSVLELRDEVTGFLDAEGEFAASYNLQTSADAVYFINVIPDGSASLDLGAAVFDSGEAQVTHIQGRGDALVISDTPTRGEFLAFTAPDTDVVGLVVWANSGSGAYRVQVRPFGQPTTEEIVAALLGILPSRGEYDVNGDGVADAADVVENIFLGR